MGARYQFTELPGFYAVMDTQEKRQICKCALMDDAIRVSDLLNKDIPSEPSESADWQVQIFNDEVGEWYAWNGCGLQQTKAAAELFALQARRQGWTTRVVVV